MPNKQTEKSFWGRVKKLPNDCWEWQGSCNSTGYGTVSWHGKVYVAHRVAAYLSGMVSDMSAPIRSSTPTHVLHKCDNRKCCNPSHFFLGTYADNQADAYQKKRRAQPHGERHVNAKLRNEQVNDIKSMYASGATQTEIAKKFNVSQRCISLIVRGETYK